MAQFHQRRVAESMSDDPIKRFTLLVLFQAQEDGATELVIAPSAATRPPIRSKVSGKWYDLSPPPSHILPGVIAELQRLAAFPDGAYPKEGTIDVPFSGLRLQWRVRMTSEDGECILTPVRE